MKHIVIVGAGFAGIKLARELDHDPRFRVTLISERPNFEYHAALYRSVTGRSQLEVAVPLKEIFADSSVELVEDQVVKIDDKKQTVTCKSKESYHYDELVLALGAVTAYFGIKGLPEYSYGMKTIAEAAELKAHLHAELTAGHKPDAHYVVVGGGPTGIELAGELVSYLRRLRKNHNIKKPFTVELVEAAPRILPVLPERFGQMIHYRLEKLGVKVYTGTAVKGETANELKLPEGSIDTHTVIWTAGMTNNPLFAAHPKLFKLGRGQKVEVDDHLSAAPHIWVAGDSAATAQAGWAQTALYDGVYIAQVLRALEDGVALPTYAPVKPVAAIPVGPNWCAVATPHGTQLFGRMGWCGRRWLDFKLFWNLLPPRLALRSWFMGTRQEESCPECRH